MPECLFCRIVNKEIPSKIEYEDDELIAINDVNPQAPLHILIIPKEHIERPADVTEGDAAIIGKMVVIAKKIATQKGYAKDGFRLVLNSGPHAGQAVMHVHLHLLAGRKFGWPPG